ncbi:SCP2 sterol-binding domain-containing protein [Pseudahrensia aquimaris]|uniref:SCP2 sterol-binding domain-containing protein n=1 Tax=Pseudahrensia aquimaris TaxID=744461 RepID=A0ABW3FCA3_9HYPH
MTLEEMTAEMQTRVAAKGAIDGKVVKFDFGDDGIMVIDGAADPASVHNNEAEADCTVVVDKDVFESIAAGEENAQMAFMSGKLKVEGDMGIAMQLGTLLS